MKNIVSTTKVINASAEKIFAILSDPRRHKEIDGSGQIQGFVDAPEKLSLGSKFTMDIKVGAPYKTTNTVKSYEENREISWSHFGRHVWKYQLKPVDENATEVTHSWSWDPCPLPERLFLTFMKFPEKNLKSMQATLERLAELLEVRPSL